MRRLASDVYDRTVFDVDTGELLELLPEARYRSAEGHAVAVCDPTRECVVQFCAHLVGVGLLKPTFVATCIEEIAEHRIGADTYVAARLVVDLFHARDPFLGKRGASAPPTALPAWGGGSRVKGGGADRSAGGGATGREDTAPLTWGAGVAERPAQLRPKSPAELWTAGLPKLVQSAPKART